MDFKNEGVEKDFEKEKSLLEPTYIHSDLIDRHYLPDKAVSPRIRDAAERRLTGSWLID